MNHLSLRKRALLVRAKLNLEKFNCETLRKYYIRYGVKFKRPDYKYYKSLAENQELQEKQNVFVHHLASAMQSRSYDEILYMDETSVHVWQKLSWSWIRPGMKLSLIRGQTPSITVLGAISMERGLVHYEVLQEHNNSDVFLNFMTALKSKCEGRKVLVVLDNHTIHYSKKLDEVYDENFKEMFLPTYSSALNPIERLWGYMKRVWGQNLHNISEEIMQGRRGRSKEEVKMKKLIAKVVEILGKYSSRRKRYTAD
jgi:transposase